MKKLIALTLLALVAAANAAVADSEQVCSLSIEAEAGSCPIVTPGQAVAKSIDMMLLAESCLDRELAVAGAESGTMKLGGAPWILEGTRWEIPGEHLIFTFGEDEVVWGGEKNVLWADRISSIWNSVSQPERMYLVVRRPANGQTYVAVDYGNHECVRWYIR